MKPKHSCCPLIEAMMTCVEHDRTGVVKASVKIRPIISHNRPLVVRNQCQCFRSVATAADLFKRIRATINFNSIKGSKNPVILHHLHIHVTNMYTTIVIKYILLYILLLCFI